LALVEPVTARQAAPESHSWGTWMTATAATPSHPAWPTRSRTRHAPSVASIHASRTLTAIVPNRARSASGQRIENFCPFHDGFDRLIRDSALSRWVGALMGGPVVLFKEKISFKMPGGPGFKMHQDQQAGWARYAPLFVDDRSMHARERLP
jgi:hypothetical protein